MIPTLALVIALNLCPKTKIINTTTYPWNEYDTATLRIANKRCGELYPKSRCVKMFKKYGERDYSVICAHTVFPDRNLIRIPYLDGEV